MRLTLVPMAALMLAQPQATRAVQAQLTQRVGAYEGRHQATSCQVTFGWVWMPERPDETVWVGLYDGDRLIAKVPADRYVDELVAAGIGDGRHGFSYAFSDSDPVPSTVEARVAGTDVRLENSPQVTSCAPRGTAASHGVTQVPLASASAQAEEVWWARAIPSVASATYVGFHDLTTCQVAAGWVWKPDHPEDTVRVDLFDGDRLIASIPADRYRKDLKEAEIGTGAYGFSYTLPDSAQAPASVEVRVAGTDIRLRRTPQPNPCVPLEAADAGAPARDGAGAEESRKVIRPERVELGSIRVDGRIDEPAWAQASVHTDFSQKALDRGFEMPGRTAVALAYDRENLYIAARLQSRHMDSVDTRLDRRDEGGNADRLLVSLDTYRDRRTAYTFGVTSTGVRLDYYNPQDSEQPQDDSFNPVWEAKTRIDDEGWTAEMRIPFSQLRFNDASEMTWGINLRRWSPQELLNLYWVVVPQSESGWASRFGDLAGLRDVGAPIRFEVAPYVLAGAVVPVGTGSGAQTESMSRLGGDAKLGLGSQLTMDLTVNPDFGQIEADPAEVNLTAFETSFPERRPFFLEGSQLFQPRGPRYFHSRRIGSVPEAGVPSYLAERPDAIRILGAAKLTGRLGSGTAVGGLFARTSETAGTVAGTDEDTLGRVSAAPATNFAVARVQQEFGTPGSSVGVLLTGVQRGMEPGSPLASLLTETAVTASTDWTIRFADGSYELSGHAGRSLVRGEADAITRVQQSSAHYFQRPDATHLSLDASRTSLTGYAAGLRLEKLAGRNWLWSIGGSVESPSFEIRDMGIFRAADDIGASATLRYQQLLPTGPFQWYSLTASGNLTWNFEGITQFASPGLYFNAQLTNQLRTYVRLSYEAPVLSDDLTRGGPLMEAPGARTIGMGLLSPFNSTTQWSVSGSYRADGIGGWLVNLDGGYSIRPEPRLGLSLYPGFIWSVDKRQFWGAWPDGRAETYGERYVFASIDRTEAYAQLRADFSLTPDLGIELYLEPFVSAGHYFDFGELARTRSGDFQLYGTEGSALTVYEDGSFYAEDARGGVYIQYPDFTVKSLRSNAVLRWEWTRGSTFHLIWQQNRWSSISGSESVGPASLFDTFGPNGDNIVTAKVTYRFGVR